MDRGGWLYAAGSTSLEDNLDALVLEALVVAFDPANGEPLPPYPALDLEIDGMIHREMIHGIVISSSGRVLAAGQLETVSGNQLLLIELETGKEF